MSDIIIADLVLSYLGRDVVTLKGDLPGHEFRGNQYSEGSGGGSGGESSGGDSGGSSGSSYIDKIHEVSKRNQIGVNREDFDKTMPHSSEVSLIKRSLVGASKSDLNSVKSEIAKSESALRKRMDDLHSQHESELIKPMRDNAKVSKIESDLNTVGNEYRRINRIYKPTIEDLIDFG